MCETLLILFSQRTFESACVSVQHDVPGSRVLEHVESQHSLDWLGESRYALGWLGSLGSLYSSMGQREVVVEVVVAVDKVNCSTVNMADSSKEMAVVVVVVVAVVVVVETGSDSEVVDLKLVQTC